MAFPWASAVGTGWRLKTVNEVTAERSELAATQYGWDTVHADAGGVLQVPADVRLGVSKMNDVRRQTVRTTQFSHVQLVHWRRCTDALIVVRAVWTHHQTHSSLSEPVMHGLCYMMNTSDVTSRHRGPKRKLPAGVARTEQFCKFF